MDKIQKTGIKSLLARMLVFGCIGVAAGFVLLVCVYALPTETMRENVRSSWEQWYGEGAWPVGTLGYSGSILDNFTDSIMLSVAVYDSGTSVVDKSMMAYHAAQPDTLKNEALYGYLMGEPCAGENYGRYWHGYLVFLKPLLLVMNYSDIRMLNGICLTALFGVTLFILYRQLGWKLAGAWLFSVAFMIPGTLLQCLDMAAMSYLTMLAMLGLLHWGERWDKRESFLLFFFITGMCTSYFDFLTYPMVTLGMPLVVYLAILKRRGRERRLLGDVLAPAVCWGLGYGGMWGAKWLLASVLTGENFILDALRSVRLRSNLLAAEENRVGRWYALYVNGTVLFQGVFRLLLTAALAALLLYLVGSFIRSRKNADCCRRNAGCCLTLALVALIPCVWLFATSQHAVLHFWFTYRNLTVSLFALFAMWALTEK